MLVAASSGGSWEQVDVNLGAFGQVVNPEANPDPELKITNADSYHGCVLGYNGLVVCTSDGWSSSNRASLGCTNLGIATIDQDNALATCFADGVRIWSTSDTGTTWSWLAELGYDVLTDDELYRAAYDSPLVFQDQSTGWFARYNLWGTKDGGKTWQRAADGIHPDLGISLVDVNQRGDGWAATASGTLLQLQPDPSNALRRPRGRRMVIAPSAP